MGEDDLKAIYEGYQKRYALPDFKSVDKELEISTLDANKFILRKTALRIKDKLTHYAEIIEELLQPDATIAMLHECSFLNEKAKTRFFELYKKLMFLIRTADNLLVDQSSAKDAKYISFFFDHLASIKKGMKEIIRVRMDSWRRELSEDIKAEYFG